MNDRLVEFLSRFGPQAQQPQQDTRMGYELGPSDPGQGPMTPFAPGPDYPEMERPLEPSPGLGYDMGSRRVDARPHLNPLNALAGAQQRPDMRQVLSGMQNRKPQDALSEIFSRNPLPQRWVTPQKPLMDPGAGYSMQPAQMPTPAPERQRVRIVEGDGLGPMRGYNNDAQE